MSSAALKFKVNQRRFARTFYYGSENNKKLTKSKMDRLSIPQTDFLIQYFHVHATFDYLDADFVNMLSYEGSVKPTAFILAMIYLERLRSMDKRYFECSDPADLLSSSLLCAMKYLYDEDDENYADNKEWAASCSKSVQHVNEKEWEFLTNIDWNLYVNPMDFERAIKSIELCLALKEGLKRGGSFTYNELTSIFDGAMKEVPMILKQMLETILIALGLATAVYVTTIVSACALAHLYNKPDTINAQDMIDAQDIIGAQNQDIIGGARDIVGSNNASSMENKSNGFNGFPYDDDENMDRFRLLYVGNRRNNYTVFNVAEIFSFKKSIDPENRMMNEDHGENPSCACYYENYYGRLFVSDQKSIFFYNVKLCA